MLRRRQVRMEQSLHTCTIGTTHTVEHGRLAAWLAEVALQGLGAVPPDHGPRLGAHRAEDQTLCRLLAPSSWRYARGATGRSALQRWRLRRLLRSACFRCLTRPHMRTRWQLPKFGGHAQLCLPTAQNEQLRWSNCFETTLEAMRLLRLRLLRGARSPVTWPALSSLPLPTGPML